MSEIGEISYASGNLDQADKAFKSYFRLAKKDENLQKEIASLRYIQNLITEGDIYTWSMDNGYWSDHDTLVALKRELSQYNASTRKWKS